MAISLIPLLFVLVPLVCAVAVPSPSRTIESRGGCPPSFRNVVFNGGYSPSQFSLITGASNWLTFSIGTNPGQIPMMAFASDVASAVSLVNGPNPPEYLLTFNEPDYSYMGFTPTMSPQDAASAIKPLLASPGPSTKFIAPVTADPTSTWLPEFYAACNCQSFFHAYNIHVYLPNAASAENDITTFHNKFADKPLWVTEIAPGNANPACSLSFSDVSEFMTDIYKWGAQQGWIERIFWNTGNEILNDNNVCNSYLLDTNNNPSPLLATFNSLDCGNASPPPPPPPPPPAPTPSNPGGGATSPQYGQCGGENWTGPTVCVAGTTCQFQNPWYSQCL